jgi:hypothetical protein
MQKTTNAQRNIDMQAIMKHYLAINQDDQAIGHIYAQSIIEARNFLSKSKKYKSAAPRSFYKRPVEERVADLPIIYGEPSANERGAGAKPSTGVRRDVKISGITQEMRQWLLTRGNRSAYLRLLITRELAGEADNFVDGTEYRRGTSVQTAISGLDAGAAHFLDMRESRSRYLRRLVAWDMSRS